MSKLSLREIAQSQLDSTPVIDGQLIVCLDTGNAYRDTATAHVKIGSDLEVVSDLPLAPLAEKLYYLKPDKLYVFLGGNWTLLNDKTIDLDKVIAKLPAGSSTALNDDVEIITQDTDTTRSHYYRRKLVVLWEYIKTKAQDFFAAKNHKHGKADITDFPTSMPASDVHPWAKAATKPSYTKAEVGLGKVDNTADADKTVKRATTAGTADSANSVAWGNVKNKPATFPVEAHTHDDRYYTEAEMNSKLSGKVDNTEAGANGLINKLSTADGVPNDATVFISQHNDGKTASYYRRPISTLWTYIKSKADSVYQPKGSYAASSHSHDDRYYTEAEVNGKLGSKVDNTEAGANGLFSKLDAWTATPTDDTYFIRQDTGGTNRFGRVKFSTIWNYIRGKTDSIYQPKGNYSTTDTKNTAGSTNTTSKLYLIGATSQSANPQTYSNASVYTTGGALAADGIGKDGYIAYPSGGFFFTQNSTITGYCKIILPVGYTSTMMSFTVTIYDYVSNESVDYKISGYNYVGNKNWYNTTAVCVGKAGASHSNLTVRFGDNGSSVVISIGESTTRWDYPQVVVHDVLLGFNDYSFNSFKSGWSIVFNKQDTPNVSQTISNTHVGYNAITSWDKIQNKPSSFTPASHTHDDRYYTETEVNTKLNGKSNTGHTHDDRYYTETEINTKLNGKANSSHTHTKSQITDFPASLKNPTALTIQTNGATAATYDGSAAKTVNVTKGNIGLGNVDNTADANKSVKYATSAGSASTATKATTADVANFAKETYINQYKTVNLTDLDQNTWYPVTGTSIPYNGLRRFKCNVQLNSGSKPSWSTHGRGFTAVVDILEEASGWGTTYMKGMVLINDQCFINDSNKPPVGYGQMSSSSTPVWWLRGGGTYFLAADYDCTWTIRKSKYENSGQSVAPTITYPGVNVSRATITANLNGNANTAEVATVGVRDYNNANNTIKIGWSGADLDANTLSYVAGYTSDMKIHTASKDGVRSWLGLGNAAYKKIQSLSAVGHSNWKNQSTDDGYVPTMAFMAFWNGAFNGSGNSNLQYCDRGRFGTIVTKNSGDYAIAGHTHNSVNDIGSGKSTTFAYSKAGMNYGDYSWLAGWNGYELRAVNKSQFATAGHTHSFSSITDKPSSYPPASHTHNYAGSASAGGAAISANALNPTVTLTGGDGNTTGYRLIGQVSIGQWSNRRCVMLVNSRHQGAGLVTVTIGNNTGSITQANAYSEIKYWGPTGSGSVISSSAYQVYISSDGKTGYLFWLFSDYSPCSVRVLGSDFTISNGTWMTGIGSGYGKCIATTQINAASTANNASTAGVATTAVKLARSGNTSYPMTFNWSGQSGQPTWLWGGNDGTNMYVYNPSNFNVNYAKSAGSVAWGNVSGKPSTYTPSSHTHTKGQVGLGNVDNTADKDKSVKYATSAGSSSTATTAAKLGRSGNTGVPMTFNWSGQGGQPTWLWGGNDGSNMYVYNPSNFSVNYANSAGNGVETSGTDYIRFSNGLQICWGDKSSGSSSGVNVFFPVPFSATPPYIGFGSITATQFTPYLKLRSNTFFTWYKEGTTFGKVCWVAIGKWK